MKTYLDIKVAFKDESDKAVAQILINHGGIIALENTVKQLTQWWDDNNPTEPGDMIPDWWLGYREAITHIKEISKGEYK